MRIAIGDTDGNKYADRYTYGICYGDGNSDGYRYALFGISSVDVHPIRR